MLKIIMYKILLGLMILLGCVHSLNAGPETVTPEIIERKFEIVNLDGVFQNHMVFQRNKKVPIWGIAQPGTVVTISFSGQLAKSVSNEEGKWSIELNPMKANTKGQVLTVSGGGHTITVKDILIGDIWVLSGQSNMQMKLKIPETMEEVKAMNISPELNLLRVARVDSFKRQPKYGRTEALWYPFTLANAKKYFISHTGFFFAQELVLKNKVPIGVWQYAKGGTPINQWLNRENINGDIPETTPYLVKSLNKNIDSETELTYKKKMDRMIPKLDETLKKINDPNTHPKHRTRYIEQYNDVKAFQRDQEELARIKKEHPEWKVLPPKMDLRKLNLYESGILPFRKMAVKGMFWYQGEANGNNGYSYRYLMPELIRHFRKDFGKNGEVLPFIFVEIPPVDGYFKGMEYLREAQRMTAMKIDKVGLVVGSDLGPTSEMGHGLGIHSSPKEPIGKRAAWIANLIDQGKRDKMWGPVFKEMKIEGTKAIISFDKVDGKLTTKDGSGKVMNVIKELKGEEEVLFYPIRMAGNDRVFHPAEAVIVDNTLVITSDKVKNPVAVRVGFDNYEPLNIVDGDGMPMAAFRTDFWKFDFDGRNHVDEPITQWLVGKGDSPSSIKEWQYFDTNSKTPENYKPPKKKKKSKKGVIPVLPTPVDPDGLIDLNVALPENPAEVCLKTIVKVPEAGEKLLWLRAGYPDVWGRFAVTDYNIWMNGNKYKQLSTSSVRCIKIMMKSGENEIIISPKKDKTWQLKAGLSNLDDSKISGLEFLTK